jgi:hypothetical protein
MYYDGDAATTLAQLVAINKVIARYPNSIEFTFNEKNPMTENCKQTLNQRGHDVNEIGWSRGDNDQYYIMYHLTQPPAQAYARI